MRTTILGPLRSPSGINPLTTKAVFHIQDFVGQKALNQARRAAESHQ